VSTIAWSPAKPSLLASGDRDNYTVVVWDISRAAGYEAVVSLQSDAGEIGGVDSLKWSPDGAFLAWASVFDGPEGARDVVVWPAAADDDEPSSVVLKLSGHSMGVSQIVWSPDSTRLAAVSLDKVIYVWSADSADGGSPLFTLDTQHDPDPAKVVWDIDWSPDGSLLMTSSWDGTITVFHLTSTDGSKYFREVIIRHARCMPYSVHYVMISLLNGNIYLS
jgi:WD40 repeat protein